MRKIDYSFFDVYRVPSPEELFTVHLSRANPRISHSRKTRMLNLWNYLRKQDTFTWNAAEIIDCVDGYGDSMPSAILRDLHLLEDSGLLFRHAVYSDGREIEMKDILPRKNERISHFP